MSKELKFHWWKLACDKSREAIAFVSTDDKFLYCNNSWCKLTGYSFSELIGKTWISITEPADIGPDMYGIQAIKDQEIDEYYIEKSYIKKDSKKVSVKLYVHRYPEHGEQEGYIVFAIPLSSKEYEDLREKFLTVQKDVLLLQQNQISNDLVNNQIKMMEQKLEQNQELMKLALNKSSSINIGDNLSGRDYVTKAGDNTNIGNININVIAVVVLSVLTFTTIGVAVLYFLLKG